jgi:ribosomal-protein-alanine N-acetyltransferase
MAAQDGTASASLRRLVSIELRTDRLGLRPLGAADREALHALWTEPAVRRFLWDDRVIDLATVDDVIGRSTAGFAAEGFGLFALREPGRAALLGVAGVYRMRPEREPELIYSLATACFGRGLATEASRAVIADAFERLGFARVLARTDSPNQASIEVMKRLGMRYAGEAVEDGLPTVSYLLAREDWQRERR